LHIKLERVHEERNESIMKYEENERYWKSKYTKVEKDNGQLFEMNKTLKEDNGDLLT